MNDIQRYKEAVSLGAVLRLVLRRHAGVVIWRDAVPGKPDGRTAKPNCLLHDLLRRVAPIAEGCMCVIICKNHNLFFSIPQNQLWRTFIHIMITRIYKFNNHCGVKFM